MGTAEEGVALGSGLLVHGGRGGLGLGVAGEERHVDACCAADVVVDVGVGCGEDTYSRFAELGWFVSFLVIDEDEVLGHRKIPALEMIFLSHHEDSYHRLCTR